MLRLEDACFVAPIGGTGAQFTCGYVACSPASAKIVKLQKEKMCAWQNSHADSTGTCLSCVLTVVSCVGDNKIRQNMFCTTWLLFGYCSI
jgi:hypothetical protein